MGDSSPAAADRDPTAATVQEILSVIPGGCTWLLPVSDEDGQVVDFRVAATGAQRSDIYGRGVGRVDARLSELYPSMVGGPLWQLYEQVLASGATGRLTEFRYEEKAVGIVAESLFDVTVHAVLGGLLVWWQRVDEDRRRLERTEVLGRLGWAEYDLASGVSAWSGGMYSIFERDPALGPMSRAEQVAAMLTEDRGISETAWQTLDSGAPSDVTVRYDIGGTVKYLRILSDIARDAGGTPLKIYAVVQDVTAREDSRSEIERLRAQLVSREMTALAEHRLAAQLQHMIQPLPQEPLAFPGVEVLVRYLPAESTIQVGGDWYHAQVLPDDRVILAIGDVAGHGLEAASGMAHLRYALVAWLSTGLGDPASLLGHVNRLCVQLKITGTAILAVYDPGAGELRWTRAGHMPPLVARAGSVDPLPQPAGLLLGADANAVYPVAQARLRADDLVLLYTDGLVERRSGSAALTKRVRQTMSEASASVDDQTLAGLVSLLNEPSPDDDTCIVAIRVLA